MALSLQVPSGVRKSHSLRVPGKALFFLGGGSIGYQPNRPNFQANEITNLHRAGKDAFAFGVWGDWRTEHLQSRTLEKACGVPAPYAGYNSTKIISAEVQRRILV